MSTLLIKCKKCRTALAKREATELFNAHNEQYSNAVDAYAACPTIYGRTEVFLGEDGLEPWIQEAIETSEWTKGKLKCLKCQSNVGSFDFVACQKCECRKFNQPAVHFIQSKIDINTVGESQTQSAT